LSIGNAIDIASRVPFPGLGLRLLHHATDLAENLALGTFAGALVALCLRYAPRFAIAVTALASAPLIHAASGHTIWRKIMIWFGGRVEWSLYWPVIAVESLAGALIFVLGHWLGSFRRAWAIAPVLALAALVVNNLVQPDQYFGDHGIAAGAVGIFAGAALARRFESRFDAWSARRYFIVATPILLFAFVPPSNAVRVELFKVPSSVGAWVLATAWWRAPKLPSEVTPRDVGPWLAGRSGDRAVPPSKAILTLGPPVVVLITIDATRADVVNEAPRDAPLPELTAMAEHGARFTNVVAPGSQTAISLSSLFSGRYFSELTWDWVGTGAKRFVYPAADPAPRFPELLTAAGIPTTLVGPIVFLNAEYGIARGFSDHRVIVEDTSHAHGAQVIDMLVDRIRAADPNRPAFFYAHLIEPHHPYDRGEKKDGPAFERYVSEIALADRLVARAARATEEKFGGRAILIVTADHAETFGEHGTWEHSKTVYEEVLHVPLLVRGGKIEKRKIDAPVGIIDLGPTILDLFRLPTPPSFMGQSLVPVLAGEPMHFTRPLFAEARLHRAYYGELKVIEDMRRRTVEAYDLTKDPKELDNVFGRDPRADRDLATLRAFFEGAPLVYRQ
jgi:arylsulfatase A-like enzyme